MTAERTAAYVPLDESRWRDAPIALTAADDSFVEAAAALRANGLDVHAWVVLNHVDRPGDDQRFSVVNAYGDRYPWALCPAYDEVVSYATTIADEVTDVDGIDGIELEACGWYGVDHMCAHDKATLPRSESMRYLLSLCFCAACVSSFTSAGVDVDRLRRDVRDTLDGPLRGAETADSPEPQRARRADVCRGAHPRRDGRPVPGHGHRPHPRPATGVADRLARQPESGGDDGVHRCRRVGLGPRDDHPRPIADALVVNCWTDHGSVAGRSPRGSRYTRICSPSRGWAATRTR